MDVTEAARQLEMSERYVRRQIASGALPCVKYGNRIRISDEQLDTFRRAHTKATAPTPARLAPVVPIAAPRRGVRRIVNGMVVIGSGR